MNCSFCASAPVDASASPAAAQITAAGLPTPLAILSSMIGLLSKEPPHSPSSFLELSTSSQIYPDPLGGPSQDQDGSRPLRGREHPGRTNKGRLPLPARRVASRRAFAGSDVRRHVLRNPSSPPALNKGATPL